MPASAGSSYSDAIGIDIPLLCVVAYESHGSMHKAHNVPNFVSWLGSVDDGEYRVAMIRIRFGVVFIHAIVRRLPATADDLDCRRSIGVVGDDDIHGQSDSFDFVIDDILDTGTSAERGGNERCKREDG